jgi:fucose 4-O-acetylase-like acetyltransferase
MDATRDFFPLSLPQPGASRSRRIDDPITRMTRRNATIDIARGLGIILVVLGHNPIVLHERGELFRVIYSFHLPLFFFLSGIFLKDSVQWGKFALSRADAILKPYFVVLVLLGMAEMLLPRLMPLAATTPLVYFSGVLYASAPTIAWTPLWFLPDLFVASLLSLAILRATLALDRNRATWLWLITAGLLATGIVFIDRFWQTGTTKLSFMGLDRVPGLPWSLDLAFISSAFMLSGFLLAKRVAALRFSAIGFLVSAVAFAALHCFFDVPMDLGLRAYGNPLISTAQAALGIYLVLCASSLLQPHAAFRRPLGYIGSGSLFILLFHYVTQGRIFLMLSHVGHNEMLVGAASLAAGVVLPLILLELVRRQRHLAALLLPLRARPPPPQNTPGKLA